MVMFVTVATPMAMLYLGSYLVLRKLQANYICARDGDHFCVGNHQVKLLAL